MPPTRIRIRHRSELIRYAYEHVRSRACQNAFYGGTVVVLGGFDQIPPSTSPGWILRVESKYQTWLVAVSVDETTHEYLVWHPPRVSWQYWSGRLGRELNIYDGDCPDQAIAKREEASCKNTPEQSC